MRAIKALVIACWALASASPVTTAAATTDEPAVPFRVRVVSAAGKPVAGIVVLVCVPANSAACDTIVTYALSCSDGTAMLSVPLRLRPGAYRVAVADPSRADLTILEYAHEQLVDGAWVYRKESPRLVCACDDRARSTTSAFQPALTSDTYNLGSTQIKTILGQR
jgi:hypothetical protein